MTLETTGRPLMPYRALLPQRWLVAHQGPAVWPCPRGADCASKADLAVVPDAHEGQVRA